MTAIRFSFHHVALSVPDLEAASDWYCDKLGFRRERDFEVPPAHAKATFLERDGMRIELFQVQDAAPLPADRSHPHHDLKTHGTKHLAFAVSDYEALQSELQSRGVETVLTVGKLFGRAFFVCDCVGNVIEFVEV